MKSRRWIVGLICAVYSLTIALAGAPSPTQAQAKGSNPSPHTPNCVYTAHGITGGGCTGNVTLQLAPGGVIATTFGIGLRVDNSAATSGTAGVYGKQGAGSGTTWNAAGVWGDSSSNSGVLGTSASGWGVYGR